METRLQQELKQSRPFESLEAMALLNILRTAAWLTHRQEQLMKEWDLTGVQYNVLRILRGAGQEGRSCQEIGERMVTLDSDITRLLDRLEKRGWISRKRDAQDRRIVRVWIASPGRKVLEQLDAPLRQWTKKHLGWLDEKQLRVLSECLEEIRTEPT